MNIPKMQNKKTFFFALLTTLFVIGLICVLYGFVGHKTSYQDGIWLDDGWKLTLRGQTYSGVKLTDFSFDATRKGDIVILDNTLPEETIEEPVLRLLALHSVVRVAVDGKEVYQYGMERAAKKLTVGSGYHYVELPDGYEGKEVRISLEVTEDNAFTTIDGILLEENGKIITDFIFENRMILCISVFLIVFGCMLILIATFAQFYNHEFQWPLWISLFSIAIGVWISCNYMLMQLFSQEYCINTLIEYTALYFAPIPMMIFFFIVGKELQLERWIYCMLSVCSILFFGVTELLQVLNISHLPAALLVFQGMLIAYIPFIILTVIRHIKGGNRTLRIISGGIIVLGVFAGCDLIRYNIRKYIDSDFMQDTISVMPIGALLFIVILIISYCVSLIDNMYVKAERELLLKMAYSDELTNIHNRAKCEEVLQELEYQGRGYAILSMDLNNLKQINDSLGHACGDRLLKDFAAILGKAFAADGTVGRMGGDEFIVILPEITKARMESRLRFMEEMMAKQNVREKDIRLSVAWGYAFNTERAGGDSGEVYELADQRMYRMKRKMKDEGMIKDR